MGGSLFKSLCALGLAQFIGRHRQMRLWTSRFVAVKKPRESQLLKIYSELVGVEGEKSFEGKVDAIWKENWE